MILAFPRTSWVVRVPIGRPLANRAIYILDQTATPFRLAFTVICISAEPAWPEGI